MGRFTVPESVRLPLSDGDYIDVKRRLNHGEREDMFARMSGSGFHVDPREVRTAKVLAYLIGWSFTDGPESGTGKPVPMSPELPEATRIQTLRSLDPDDFEEIHSAIDAHEKQITAERAEAKKKRTGTPVDDPISPSLSAVDGLLIKSAP